MFIKKSKLVFVLLSFAFANLSNAQGDNLKFSMEKGREISYQFIKAKKSNLPTFLFLPGVNRGLRTDEVALESLANQGFGIITMNFSNQPFSVNLLDKNTKPSFINSTYKLDDFNKEIIALSNDLKKNFAIKNIIPVSISFSSAVSSSLTNFPIIIDTVPMTSSAAVNPELEAYRSYLKAGEIFNPIYGPAITRSLLDQTYYKKWREQVDSIVSQFDLKEDRKAEMVEGYTVFSRASEGFVWDLTKTSANTRRVFMFARNDSSTLLKNQLELFLKALENNSLALAFIVNDAGHVLPVDQPQSYANILTYIGTADIKNVSGIFEIEPNNNTPKFFQGADARKYIKDLINTL